MTKRVMIIDDDDRVLKIFELFVRSFGYKAIPVSDPNEGLRMLSDNPPSLILLDLMMSPMDGSKFLDERRKIAGALDIPVVICSAWRPTVEELAAYKDEIAGILPKPVESAQLREILEKLIGS